MEEPTAVPVIGVGHDNKENVPPAAAKFSTRLPVPLSSVKTKKKKVVVLSNGRQRQPLADITNLVHCRIGRYVADMNTVLLVPPQPAVVSSRKRRAVDEIDQALKSATASKSLRMGFR